MILFVCPFAILVFLWRYGRYEMWDEGYPVCNLFGLMVYKSYNKELNIFNIFLFERLFIISVFLCFATYGVLSSLTIYP